MNLYVINNTQWNCPDVFMTWLFSTLRDHLESLGVNTEGLDKELGVVFVEHQDMLALNTTYRGKHYATDVLSFAMDGGVLGEIVLCPDVIVKQAEEHDLHQAEELAYLFLHGILHLLGFDHEQDTQRAAEMFHIQDKVFDLLLSEDIVEIFSKSLVKSI